jgi:serine/threonine-protein kinase ATR
MFHCSIFDKGLNLPRPEVVPFRLTPNIVDAFGPAGSDGMFTTGMRSCMGILRDNRDTLLSVLEPFVKDPVIDWKRHRSQQPTQTSTGSSTTTKTSASEAKRSIQIIKERLSGIYNLRNPNLRTYRHIIISTRQHDEDDETMMAEIPLSVEGQVKKLIVEASKNENLVQLYVGWMPWV